MTLDPLLNASPAIQIHTGMAIFAVLLTIAVFSIKRGSGKHRVLGWTWVICMGVVALSSFWISELRLVGPFSPIHLLSIFVLIQLFNAVRAARSGKISRHSRTMKGMVFGALLLAGAFTFFPGRIMFLVVTGS